MNIHTTFIVRIEFQDIDSETSISTDHLSPVIASQSTPNVKFEPLHIA